MRGPGSVSAFAAPSSPDVFQFATNGAAVSFAQNSYQGFGVVSTTPSGTDLGGSIGFNGATGTGGGVDLVALIIHNSTLAAAQELSMRQALDLESGISPQPRDICLFDGDSIVNGVGVTGLRSWAVQLQSVIPDCRYYNSGVPGQSTTYIVTNFATAIGRVYDATAPNFVIYEEYGVNNFLNLSYTAAQLEASITTVVGMEKALGPNVRVILPTVVEPCSTSSTVISACPKATSSQLTQIQAYNTWLRAGGYITAGADTIADVDASPIIGGVNGMYQPSNTADGLHPEAQGGSAWVPIIAAAINSVRK